MMKERTRGFITGIMASVLIFALAGGAFAASQSQPIEVSPIKVMVNGAEFQPKDADGNDVLVFVYNGTTYAPLRALAEAFGLEVGYDADARMATVTNPYGSQPADQLPAQIPDQIPDQIIVEVPVQPASNGGKIYITPTGKRYHYDSNCNGGTYYESTLEDALKRGLTPCDKCVQ